MCVCDLQFPADFFSNFNTNFNSIAAGSGSVSSIGTGNQEALASGSGSQSAAASGQNAFASAVSGTGGSLLHGSWSPHKLALTVADATAGAMYIQSNASSR